MKRPNVLAAAATLLVVTTSGCYGQFALTRKLYGWNGRATGNVFANSAIMWGLIIIPVYPLAGLGDFLIFNTIEVFTGSNPVALQEGDRVRVRHAGAEYLLSPGARDRIEVSRDGIPLFRYRREADRLVIEDTAGRTLKTIDLPQAMAAKPGPRIY